MISEVSDRCPRIAARDLSQLKRRKKPKAALCRTRTSVAIIFYSTPDIHLKLQPLRRRDSRPLKGREGVEKQLQPKVIVYLKEKGDPIDRAVEVIDLHGWQRMGSKIVELQAGVTYEVICSSWAPGVCGMCWVSVAAHGAVFKPKLFETPTPNAAAMMKDQGLGGTMVCVGCQGALKSYFNNESGPMCSRCVAPFLGFLFYFITPGSILTPPCTLLRDHLMRRLLCQTSTDLSDRRLATLERMLGGSSQTILSS